jgi:hypothetical protein
LIELKKKESTKAECKKEENLWPNANIVETNTTRHSRLRSEGKPTSSTASSAQFKKWRRLVIIAAAKLSATELKTAAVCFVVRIAREKAAKTGCAIVFKPAQFR